MAQSLLFFVYGFNFRCYFQFHPHGRLHGIPAVWSNHLFCWRLFCDQVLSRFKAGFRHDRCNGMWLQRLRDVNFTEQNERFSCEGRQTHNFLVNCHVLAVSTKSSAQLIRLLLSSKPRTMHQPITPLAISRLSHSYFCYSLTAPLYCRRWSQFIVYLCILI